MCCDGTASVDAKASARVDRRSTASVNAVRTATASVGALLVVVLVASRFNVHRA